MLAKNLQKAVIQRGGEASIIERNGAGYELTGTLGNYDVHMFLCNGGNPASGGNSYFTVRPMAARGQYDPFSDYNPGGWTFCDRIKDLAWATRS